MIHETKIIKTDKKKFLPTRIVKVHRQVMYVATCHCQTCLVHFNGCFYTRSIDKLRAHAGGFDTYREAKKFLKRKPHTQTVVNALVNEIHSNDRHIKRCRKVLMNTRNHQLFQIASKNFCHHRNVRNELAKRLSNLS